jgi:CRP/FNR family transcriptional regulator
MTSEMIIEKLKQISLFKSLNEDEYELLASISKYETYPPNSTIFYEKEKLKYIYFLVKGSVKLYKVDRFDSEIFLNRLEENSFIYTVSNLCVDDDPLGVFYSVEAIEQCQILLINVKKFKSLFLTKPEIMKGILQESYQSILQLQYILNRDIVYDGMAKVSYKICNELDSFNSMKKHEVAYCLHLQPETLSRILKKMVRNNLIELENGKVSIKNIGELKNIYE